MTVEGNSPPLDPAVVALGESVRGFFPIFSRAGKAVRHYLDSAASTQKPSAVIDRLVAYYEGEHSNIHRGAYSLSAQATLEYEAVRDVAAEFLGGLDARGVVFTRGATEGVNLVAHALEQYFQPGDALLCTVLDHHSNLIPWQLLGKRRQLGLHFVEVSPAGEIELDHAIEQIRSVRPKLLAITQHSNALGTVVALEDIIDECRKTDTLVLVDATQSVAHGLFEFGGALPDFVVFSGHKVYGPTGIGVLWVRPDRYELMEPFQGGGEMILEVTREESIWAEPPRKFEAGTPAIAETVGLGSALQFVSAIGRSRITKHEAEIFDFCWEGLSKEPGVTVYGPRTVGGDQAGIISFNVEGVHPHDLATFADECEVQIRAGHHCAMPLMKSLGIPGTARASFGMYSTEADVEALLEGIRRARKVLSS